MAEPGSESIPSEVADQIHQYHSSLREIGAIVRLLEGRTLDDLGHSLDPLSKVKLRLQVTNLANALFFMYLNTQGLQPRDHPVKMELERMKMYHSKLESLETASKIKTHLLDEENTVEDKAPRNKKSQPKGLEKSKIKKSS